MKGDVVPIEDVVALIRALEAGEKKPLLRRAIQFAPWLRPRPIPRTDEELYDAKSDELRKKGLPYRDTVRDMKAVKPPSDPEE